MSDQQQNQPKKSPSDGIGLSNLQTTESTQSSDPLSLFHTEQVSTVTETSVLQPLMQAGDPGATGATSANPNAAQASAFDPTLQVGDVGASGTTEAESTQHSATTTETLLFQHFLQSGVPQATLFSGHEAMEQDGGSGSAGILGPGHMPLFGGPLPAGALGSAAMGIFGGPGNAGLAGLSEQSIQRTEQTTTVQATPGASDSTKKKKRPRKAPRSKHGTPKCRSCKRTSKVVVVKGSYMMTTPCGHVFCHPCSKRFRNEKQAGRNPNRSNCPTCKFEFENNTVRKVKFY